MKKTLTTLVLFAAILTGTSAYILKSSNGIAGQTGSPGENTCGAPGCHGGGSSSSQDVTITASPSFTADQYMADSTYQISVQVNALGFSRFGFGCEILDSLNANAGTIQTPGTGVKFLNYSGRRNAVHTTPKVAANGATFTFQWVAPSEGRANFYVCGNAVNGNGNTSGDLPIPFSMFLYPAPVTHTIDTVVIIDNIVKQKMNTTELKIYPNPVADFANLSYKLVKTTTVSVTLIDLQGVSVREMFSEKQSPGAYSRILDFTDIGAGVYFLRTSENGKKVSQKLVTVQ